MIQYLLFWQHSPCCLTFQSSNVLLNGLSQRTCFSKKNHLNPVRLSHNGLELSLLHFMSVCYFMTYLSPSTHFRYSISPTPGILLLIWVIEWLSWWREINMFSLSKSLCTATPLLTSTGLQFPHKAWIGPCYNHTQKLLATPQWCKKAWFE